ncbi:pilus assembly protein N-terminal domain-containing protein [Cohaesibacter gelatinilyticus]|uniref:Pilus formation protein N terminal region n=1 Tax=Cohaesibacter gelatinilyticus TaxID=372072 RepID=A0A285PHI7_9HYPH|nr:pilus assembly protein N-terminal domain-containing protein [Cohaesibacter gelatinilyticus]SNZ20707.1 Pilus formation protein N terminal region [Cohaesibacter gelatinilyticus]
MKILARFLALSLFCSLLPVSAKANQETGAIQVKVDRAKVMKIARPASMIIIGNPAIADATIKDSQTLIITGKRYGTTNLIVLDSAGEPIADEVLTVSSDRSSSVVVYRGAKRSTLNCSPECDPVYRIGDDPDTLSNLSQQFSQHFSDATSDPAQIDGE